MRLLPWLASVLPVALVAACGGGLGGAWLQEEGHRARERRMNVTAPSAAPAETSIVQICADIEEAHRRTREANERRWKAEEQAAAQAAELEYLLLARWKDSGR